MSLIEKLKNDVTEALKAGDSLRAETLRGVVSSIHNEEIAMRAKSLEITEEDVVKVLKKEAKKRREAIEVYTSANRSELSDKEKKELEIISSYLPPEMGEGDIRVIVKNVIEKEGSDNFGNVMKAVMEEIAGRAEAGTVANIVKTAIGGN